MFYYFVSHWRKSKIDILFAFLKKNDLEPPAPLYHEMNKRGQYTPVCNLSTRVTITTPVSILLYLYIHS